MGAEAKLTGQVLEDRYKVETVLGEGGMGTVYRGQHVAIGRTVAIKVLRPGLAESEDLVRRFEREARAAGSLSHPNCVPVTDFGRLADGTLFLVMEFVEGKSLADLLEEVCPLPAERALKIIRHVLRGLSHAHALQIVHRDIKPDNVMLVSHAGEPEFARVVDFGIARLADAGDDKLTQAGMTVGTPTYLSPEQAVGSDTDHRSDLYSCAVMLFELISGKPPFQAASPVGVLTKHAAMPPPTLAEVSGAPVPAELESLMARGLAKLPPERFQSAAEFIAAIDVCLGDPATASTSLPAQPASGASEGTRDLRTPGGALVEPTMLAPDATTPAPAEVGGRVAHTPPTMIAPTSGITGEQMVAQPPLTGPQMAVPPLTGERMVTPPLTGEHAAVPMPESAKRRLRAALIISSALAVLAILIAVSAGGGDEANGPAVGVNVEKLLNDSIYKLENAETCEERRDAVGMLRRLGDPRAIPALKRARRRMRGGVLGVGARNENRCLRKAAIEAIEELESQ